MIKRKFNKNRYGAYDAVRTHFSNYFVYYLICIACVIFGIVLGVLTILNTGVTIEIDCLTDELLLDFMQDDCSWISFLFYKLVESIFVFALIFICVYNIFLMPIALIVIVFKTYYYAINITILILCLNVFGIMNTIFIILPVYILTIVAYVIFACIILKLSFEFHRCKNVCIDSGFKNKLLKIFLCLLVFRIVLIIYEVIMLSIFCNKFIIS